MNKEERVSVLEGEHMGYTTIQGQTWDQIAKDVYGEERYADILMRANMIYLDTFIFEAGVELYTPVPEETVEMPPWRT